MYSYDDVYAETLAYFNGDELAADVWIKKYCLQDNDGHYLEKTPDDMHHRLAKEFARIEEGKFKKPLKEEEIYQVLRHFKRIILQGSPMYGIGNPYQYVTLSNCYVLPSPHDSFLGINYLDTQIAAICSRRGGVGWDISTLRPTGTVVQNAAKTTSGATSFMHRFSNTIREVCQSGRRGASLQSMSIHHPEILQFITSKQDLTKITGSNISVQFTDEFFQALEDKKNYELRFPVDNTTTPEISRMISAQKVWDVFIECAWKTAEPGSIFIDNVHKESTSAPYTKEVSCNPCAEQFLPPYSCCRLLCINLYSYVDNPFTPQANFNIKRFTEDCYLMQRLADDMVDLDIESMDRILQKIESDPEPQHIKQIGIDLWKNIKQTTINDRRTGCGITGLADYLAALNLKYDSDDAILQAENAIKAMKLTTYKCSVDMAKELSPFPLYDENKDKTSLFIQRIKQEDPALYSQMKKYGRRNITLLTIAPTGSVSLMTQTSSGVEPVFMLEYTRRKKCTDDSDKVDFVDKNGDKWSNFTVTHHGLSDYTRTSGKTLEQSPYYKSTSHDIDYMQKIKLQACIQKHIDNSISVTHNLPANITKEEISDIYKLAYKLGCKGCTVYREGSRDGILIAKDNKTSTERPKELPCDVHHVTVKGQKFFVLVGLKDSSPYEIFAGLNNFLDNSIKSGIIIKKKKNFYKVVFDNGDELSPITGYMQEEYMEIISRLTSSLLRNHISIIDINHQLEKIGENRDINCFSRAISRILKKYIKDGEKDGSLCPECSSEMVRISGCATCLTCGYSKCM